MLTYPRYFFIKEKKRTVWTGGIRNWVQHTGLVRNTVSSCISLLISGMLRLSSGISQLVKMSGQKLQVKQRSNCMQELSPSSALNKPAVQGNTWAWPGLKCAALRKASREFRVHREGQVVLAAPALRLMGWFCLTFGSR